MKSFWRTAILAVAAMSLMAAGSGLAVAATTSSVTRVETSSTNGSKPETHMWINGKEVKPGDPLVAGDSDNGVHIWINGKEIKPGDPIDLGGGGSVRVEARSGAADAGAEAIPRTGEAYLGVMANPLEGKARDEIESHKGVMVTTVLPGSPAAKAGLQAGDVIAEVGGKQIETPQELVDRVREQKPGAEVKVVYYREGKRIEKNVKLGVRPGTEPVIRPLTPAPKEPEGGVFLGLVPATVTKDAAGIAGTEHGALVSSIPDESPAAKAGLEPGDVIVSIGGKEIGSPEELIKAVGEHKPGEVVKVVYLRSGKKKTAEVKLGARPAERGQPEMNIPDEVLRNMPELRQFLDEMRKGMEGRMTQPREGRPNLTIPAIPLVPREPPSLATEPYGVGKDIGKILERLDQLDRRLDQIEKRLDQMEKKK
jgi:membrane-associated protease RseP (regulator of RpoE activity)